ncbi:MAG TPA: hypothetical protein VKH64_12605 [Candidatus Binatia bacterium]|nr:hypothetical protein [Candidatus Binatia bacterium]
MRALSASIIFASFAALSACSLTQPSAPGEPGPPPATKKLARPDDLSFLRVQTAAARQGRIIYIGVYGGQVPTWEAARYFIPKDWPPYQKLSGEEDLARVAYHDSLMHVLALEIARRFPDSITVMIKGDAEVVAEVARYLYAPGDKLYLVGHSQGGGVVAEAAVALRDARIPIQMIVEMEGFLAYRIVPRNVIQAFNFYVPTTFSICPGRDKLEAEDPAATRIVNIAVPDPSGPFNGPCAAHRNIDSDARVWKPVLQYILESAGRSPDSPLQPASAGGSAR